MLECPYSYDVIMKIYIYVYRIDLIRIIILKDRSWLREKNIFLN